MFLTKEELKTVSPVAIIDIITNTNDATVEQIIVESVATMKSYLHRYFDTDAVFSATGSERNALVLKHLKKIVVFELYNIRKGRISEQDEKGYNEAMRWLEKVGAGEIGADLPAKQKDTDGDGEVDTNTFLKLGSRKNYRNSW